MADAHDMTEDMLKEVEGRVSEIYKQASDDMAQTVNDFFSSFGAKDAEQAQAVLDGKITESQYMDWKMNTLARGQGYEQMRDKLAERYTDANEVAMAYVNDKTPEVYSLNRNYTAYTIEEAGEDVDFHLWNEAAVRRNLVENPDLMPYYPEEKAVARGIDLAYGKQQITSNVTSGILQGLSPYQIADNLQKSIENMNRTSAVRAARTAFTAAENAGCQDAFEEAADMGIPLEKEWVATEDDRTREEHDEADGQVVPYDEPFVVGGEELMYPGDDSMGASGWNIYNCRCTMIARVAGVDMSDADKWAKESFEDWEEEKEESGWLEDTEAEEMLNSINAGNHDTSWMEELEQGEEEVSSNETEYKQINTKADLSEVFGASVDQWRQDMSPEEEEGVIRYTGSAYGRINSYMRGQRSEISDELKETIDNIESAISKFELTEDIVVYRRMTSDVYDEFVEVGGVFTDPGYLSTSTRSDLSGFGSDVIEIHVQAGTGRGAYVGDILQFKSEREFLMQHDSAVLVESEKTDAWGNRYSVGTLIVD